MPSSSLPRKARSLLSPAICSAIRLSLNSSKSRSRQLFVQKYQLYLPDREELRRELERTLLLAHDRARVETPES